VGPDFGIGGRELTAVGKRGFHRGVAMAFEQGDGKAAFGQGIGGGDTGDAAANDCNGFHESELSYTSKDGATACKPHAGGAPSVSGPERFTARTGAHRLLLRCTGGR
jgi:hypothetical protein